MGEVFPIDDSPPSNLDGKQTTTPQQNRTQPTVFPQDHAGHSIQTFLYRVSRHVFAGAPLIRWLLILIFLCGIVGFVGFGVGRWVVVPLCLLLILVLLFLLRQWRRVDFVQFEELPPFNVISAPLTPDDKIPVHCTGYFSVENKSQRFTWLPGFYRTFATREHALLCKVDYQKFLGIGEWPSDDVGMWYVFFYPRDIERIQWGRLYFDNQPRLAVAVDRRVTIPATNRLQRDKDVIETIYLACATEDDGRKIVADLLHDLPNSIFV